MTARVESKQVESWNIQDTLATRNHKRMVWEEDFRTNMGTVADKISESITREVLGKIGKSLSDPYKPRLYTEMKFSLELRKNAPAIKKWAQETADLAPFKEWFEVFEKTDQDPVAKDDFASTSLIRDRDETIDVKYFQELMAHIGRRVETKVRKALNDFTANPQNARLRTDVVWHRKSEKPLLVLSSSFEKDNFLSVTAWISPPSHGEPPSPRGVLEKPPQSNCILL